jgi:hypothetical protein
MVCNNYQREGCTPGPECEGCGFWVVGEADNTDPSALITLLCALPWGGMNISRQEEIIAALWCIASLLSFNGGYVGWGWFFAIKSGSDIIYALRHVRKELLEERKAHNG